MRVWSAVRPEIQSVFLASLEFMRTDAQDSSSKSAQPQAKLSALELARLLCETYVDQPVTSVVGNEDEEQCLRRVLSVMGTQQAELVEPLQRYIKTYIQIPVIMHDVMRSTVAARGLPVSHPFLCVDRFGQAQQFAC